MELDSNSGGSERFPALLRLYLVSRYRGDRCFPLMRLQICQPRGASVMNVHVLIGQAARLFLLL